MLRKMKKWTVRTPTGIDGVMGEFMVHLVRAMKDTQVEEKHCYHCSSLEHFIHNCPLVKASGVRSHLNNKEGDGTKEGSLDPSDESDYMPKTSPGGGPQGVG